MKILRLCFFIPVLIACSTANSQILRVENPSLDLTGGVGMSSYYGDLVQNNAFFRQPGFSISTGLAYNLNPNTSFRAEFALSKVQGNDSKNSRADLKARNLSFKSSVWDFNVSVEYNILDMSGDRKFTPYVFGGIGVAHFNPYTKDRNGKKVVLQSMGTEGQGLAAYPERKPYSRTALELPFGGGVKFAVSTRMVLGLEFKYRYLSTDYLDDVSNFGYPSQAALAAKNPSLPMLTYRGDELPGGAPYPAVTLNRGNPNNKDSYYSFQLKVGFRLKNYSGVEINY